MTTQGKVLDVWRKVRAIYRAIMAGPPSPEEMARQCRACLIAAAGLRMRASGLTPWYEGGDALAQDLADEMFEAMDRLFERRMAERN